MNKKPVLPIVALIVGTSIGSGGVWQYAKLELERSRTQLEETVRLSELRQRQLQIFREISKLTEEYAEMAIKDCAAKTDIQRDFMLSELQLLRDSYNSTEVKLAELENRQPLETYAFIDPCSLSR